MQNIANLLRKIQGRELTWEEEDGNDCDGPEVDGRGHVAGGAYHQAQALGNQAGKRSLVYISYQPVFSIHGGNYVPMYPASLLPTLYSSNFIQL
jgi:hypothetical protein